MAQGLTFRVASCCCRRAVKFAHSTPHHQQSRSMLSVHVGPVQKLPPPKDIPEAYLSQIPRRLRPGGGPQKIKVLPAIPSERSACKDPISYIDTQQLSLLDPTGARTRLFDPKNPDGAKAGDIILATFKTGEPFSGVALSVKWRGPHTSVLLRNQLTRVGTEMDIKVFSPLIQSMEVVQKATKRPRRARLFYLRKKEHDVGSVQKVVDQYLRQKVALTSGGSKGQGGARGGKGKKGGRR